MRLLVAVAVLHLSAATLRRPSVNAGGNWTAHRLHAAAKAPQNARCLDGSPPLYYYSPATSEDAKDKWQIHMEGGAWCANAQACTTWWGFRSTDDDPDSLPADAQAVLGYFNRSLETNPMRDWNFVFVRYCDGFSFAGGVNKPQTVQFTNHSTGKVTNVTVWLRGRAVLDAIISNLLTKSEDGLRTATDVVVGGCSAGGMAVYLNCDHWASRIGAANAGARVRCLADSGWFPLIPLDWSGSTWFNGVWSDGFAAHNASMSTNARCRADHDADAAWQCALPQVAVRYVHTPLFAYQARYDAYQIPNMLQDCFGNRTDKFGGNNCSGELFTAWGSLVADNMTAWLQEPRAKAAGHAAYISSCYFHCGSTATWGLVRDATGGSTGAQAFGQWLTDPRCATTRLWNHAAAWNVTSEAACGGTQNTPGWEKRTSERSTLHTAQDMPARWRVAF